MLTLPWSRRKPRLLVSDFFFAREGAFVVTVVLLIVLSMLFSGSPVLAMWFGFAVAGYSAIANDSIQTLGTFLSSNRKLKWWLL